ncbi:MAG: NUDIX domain-containing protein [Bacteroidia bacterium]|jgi:bifunctional NMN adenylyltransferase/nudix hydrolase|nr:NUDIX domain-containing protein [Bacteroidia bacterium]
METSSHDIGVLVGRFQVNELHDGHIRLIESVTAIHKRIVIFLGVSPALVTRNNPLDFVARKAMLLERFPQASVLSIPDMSSDHEWSLELDKRIREACPVGSVLLYGGRDNFIRYYCGHFQTADLGQFGAFSGTELRKEVSREVRTTADFRAGVIYAAYNQYPKVFPTVDVAIVKGNEVLLGRKPHQQKFRFIGGFSDPADENYETAALREAEEETGLKLGNPVYLGSARIDDWRYRSEQDKIITLFFKADYTGGEPHAQDDIAELRWFSVNELRADELVNEHHVLLHILQKQF